MGLGSGLGLGVGPTFCFSATSFGSTLTRRPPPTPVARVGASEGATPERPATDLRSPAIDLPAWVEVRVRVKVRGRGGAEGCGCARGGATGHP